MQRCLIFAEYTTTERERKMPEGKMLDRYFVKEIIIIIGPVHVLEPKNQ